MKRLFFLTVLFVMSLTVNAQRCAVFDFQIGTGVTEEEIDGLTYNFRANFSIDGYTMLERTRINRTIESLGYNRSDMTMQQMLKVGRVLEAKLVVVGTMNKFMDEYSVDMRVIDVATGVTCASEGTTFTKSSYRTSMETLADRLGKKVGGNTSSSGSASGGGSNTKPSQKAVAQGYTDLGLPSGTIWKNFNATGFYTYGEAVSQFGSRLPSKEQWEELKAECQWSWTGSGYKVTGPNGNSITLPAAGGRLCGGGKVIDVGSKGYYMSSTPGDSMWQLNFDSESVDLSGNGNLCYGRSVRLVQD